MIIVFGPEVHAIPGTYQLGSYPNLVALAADRALQDMGNAILKAQGIDVEKTIARLQELKEEFGKGGATDAQKKALQQEAMGIQQKLQQSQDAAMADPKLKQAATKMEKDLIAEMTVINPFEFFNSLDKPACTLDTFFYCHCMILPLLRTLTQSKIVGHTTSCSGTRMYCPSTPSTILPLTS